MAFLLLAAAFAAEPEPKSAKDALQPFNLFVGSWKGTGYPDGTREERANGFWQETVAWEWLFKKDDVAVVGTVEKGKHFVKFELRYSTDKKQYQLTATTPEKTTQTFAGALTTERTKGQVLTLDRTDETKESQRLVFTLLHNNRYLYKFETKPLDVKAFTRLYEVGSTKEGEPFADVPKGPECIVSGGLGKIPLTYKGQTYYVCCSGCRDEFKDSPEKYIKEFEEKQKKKK
jgi:hypothetical protein